MILLGEKQKSNQPRFSIQWDDCQFLADWTSVTCGWTSPLVRSVGIFFCRTSHGKSRGIPVEEFRPDCKLVKSNLPTRHSSPYHLGSGAVEPGGYSGSPFLWARAHYPASPHVYAPEGSPYNELQQLAPPLFFPWKNILSQKLKYPIKFDNSYKVAISPSRLKDILQQNL